jgi:molecular chaperone GrpE
MSEGQTEQPNKEQTSQPKKELETLTQAIDLEKKRSEAYLSRLKYMQADFENLKKRMNRELETVQKYCNERLLIALLEVVDELELAVKSCHSTPSSELLVQGVEMTLKKLNKLLEQEGVSPIECVGKPFDPSKHNAASVLDKVDGEMSTVIEEIRKGYILKEKVLRPSIVKVMRTPLSKIKSEVNSNE